MIANKQRPSQEHIDLNALVSLQSDGMKARSWGMSADNNPVPANNDGINQKDTLSLELRHAWDFGWAIEDEWLRTP